MFLWIAKIVNDSPQEDLFDILAPYFLEPELRVRIYSNSGSQGETVFHGNPEQRKY